MISASNKTIKLTVNAWDKQAEAYVNASVNTDAKYVTNVSDNFGVNQYCNRPKHSLLNDTVIPLKTIRKRKEGQW